MKYYEECCINNNINYDLFLWDRDNNKPLEQIENKYIFHHKCVFGGGKLQKIYPMYQYQKHLRNIIKKNKYTHLVIINTLASVMISDLLLNSYKNKYIMDIRDYTYEKLIIYKMLVDRLIDYSFFSTISSKGFYRFINKNNKIMVNHNISNVLNVENLVALDSKKNNIIGFVGSIRYKKENIALINSLKDSSHYKLKYVGPFVSDCNLKDFCLANNIKNVDFMGSFNNDDKPKIYKDIDIINSIYGQGSLEVTTAIPNRYYDALIYKKPIIASKGTYLGELVENNNLGIVVDVFNDDIKKLLDKYIVDFDSNMFMECCNKELQNVVEEQKCFIKSINIFLNNEDD